MQRNGNYHLNIDEFIIESIYMSDTDGYYVGALISPDQMEMVYLEAGTKSRVAAYSVYTRVK